LDHYEGRGFLGWHHHVTMNMIAYEFLLLEMMRYKKISGWPPPENPADDPGHTDDMGRSLPDLRQEGQP
jgi:hypothetical protein